MTEKLVAKGYRHGKVKHSKPRCKAGVGCLLSMYGRTYGLRINMSAVLVTVEEWVRCCAPCL